MKQIEGQEEFADMRRRPAMTTAQAREIAWKYRERQAAGLVKMPLSVFMARIINAAALES